MKLQTDAQVRSAERTLAVGTWSIVAGAMLYSVLTVTPLVDGHTTRGWGWTAPILPLVVDSAVVIVVRLDSTLARLGGSGGGWPAVLRWMTGLMTLLLNIGQSALHHDRVGMAVHSVAPLLLIVTGEAGLAYRRAISRALARLDRERATEQAERERQQVARERVQAEQLERERAAREQAEREERERLERSEREAREHAERLERERAERETRERREEREHAARLAREQADREERRVQAEREERARVEREQRERDDRERLEHEAREQAEQAARERAHAEAERVQRPRPERRERAPRPARERVLRAVPSDSKMIADEAVAAIRAGLDAGDSVRKLAEETGWSVGWVSARITEIKAEQDEDDEDSEPEPLSV